MGSEGNERKVGEGKGMKGKESMGSEGNERKVWEVKGMKGK